MKLDNIAFNSAEDTFNYTYPVAKAEGLFHETALFKGEIQNPAEILHLLVRHDKERTGSAVNHIPDRKGPFIGQRAGLVLRGTEEYEAVDHGLFNLAVAPGRTSGFRGDEVLDTQHGQAVADADLLTVSRPGGEPAYVLCLRCHCLCVNRFPLKFLSRHDAEERQSQHFHIEPH